MLTPRASALAIGILGACLGILAVIMSAPLLGAGAGLLALGAGGIAFATPPDTSEMEQRLALHEATEDDLRTEVARGQERLSDADQRLRALAGELAAARTELAAASEPAETPPDGDRAALIDRESQLFSDAYFRVALDARIASARRHLRPVAIALIEVHEGVAEGRSGMVNPARGAEAIRDTVRDADTPCRLADGTFAIIMEDTPENGAVWTVERVRRNLVGRFGGHTMWAGVACYPAHAFDADELIHQAGEALRSAREWNQDRIEVAVSE